MRGLVVWALLLVGATLAGGFLINGLVFEVTADRFCAKHAAPEFCAARYGADWKGAPK